MALSLLGTPTQNYADASQMVAKDTKEQEMTQRALEASNKPLGEVGRMAAEKELSMIEITPQLARGAAKATGDSSWEKAVGTRMRADVYSSLLTMGTRFSMSKKVYNTKQGPVYWEPGMDKPEPIPDLPTEEELEKLRTENKIEVEGAKHKNKMAEIDEAGKFKGKGGRGGGGSGSQLPAEDKEFMKTYRQYMKETEGINRVIYDNLAKNNPTQKEEVDKKLKFIQDGKTRFDKLQGLEKNAPAGGGQGDQSGLPAPALKALQDAEGKVVTFQNGQSWQWKNGKAVRVS